MKLHYFIHRHTLPAPRAELEQLAIRLPELRQRWWCGYVCLPAGHPCHGMTYSQIEDIFNIAVHGGLTFAMHVRDGGDWRPLESEKVKPDDYIVGFDTGHAFDTDAKCTAKYTMGEARRLALQFEIIHDAFESLDWRKLINDEK